MVFFSRQMVEDAHPLLPSGVSGELTDFLKQCFTRNAKERPSCAQLLEVPALLLLWKL
jgi:hypothetical protein